MTQNLIILWPTPLEGATLTSTTAATSMPASNMLLAQPGKPWRSAGVTETIKAALASAATAVDAIGVIASNLNVYDTIRVRGSDDVTLNDLAVYGYDSGVLTDPSFSAADYQVLPSLDANFLKDSYSLLPSRSNVHRLHILSSQQSYRGWRVDIEAEGNPDGYVQVGRLYAARKWQLEVNMALGSGVGFIDPSTTEVTRGGAIRIDKYGKRRQLNIELDFQSEAQMRAYAYQLAELRGAADDVMVIMDADQTTYLQQDMVYGVFRDLQPIINDKLGLYRTSYRIEELAP